MNGILESRPRSHSPLSQGKYKGRHENGAWCQFYYWKHSEPNGTEGLKVSLTRAPPLPPHLTGLSESQDPTAPDGPWEDEGSGRSARTWHRRQKNLMTSKEGPERRSFNRWWQTPGTCPVRPPPFVEMKTDLGERIETFKYCVAILNDSFISSEGIS